MKNIPLLFLALVLAGCFGGKVPQTRFYLLDYVPTPVKVKPTPFKLRVKDFSIAETYRRTELVYRQSAHELLFYNYHQWAVKPEHLVSDMVFKHLRASNLFKSMSASALDFEPDYILTGEIQALEEYDNRDKWYAHIAITLQMENVREGKLVWKQAYDKRKMVSQQEPVYVVRELSHLLELILNMAVEDLDKYFSKLPEATSLPPRPDRSLPTANETSQDTTSTPITTDDDE